MNSKFHHNLIRIRCNAYIILNTLLLHILLYFRCTHIHGRAHNNNDAQIAAAIKNLFFILVSSFLKFKSTFSHKFHAFSIYQNILMITMKIIFSVFLMQVCIPLVYIPSTSLHIINSIWSFISRLKDKRIRKHQQSNRNHRNENSSNTLTALLSLRNQTKSFDQMIRMIFKQRHGSCRFSKFFSLHTCLILF